MITQAYRHLIIPGFESLVKRRRTFAFWRELEESQWWSREQLETLQLQRLRRLIEYCFAHSAYYRDLWNCARAGPATPAVAGRLPQVADDTASGDAGPPGSHPVRRAGSQSRVEIDGRVERRRRCDL